MDRRIPQIVLALAAMILLTACGGSSSAGDSDSTSEPSPTAAATPSPTPSSTATATASPTIAPSATTTQRAVAPTVTATADGTPSGGPRVPDAPAASPAYLAPLFEVALPGGYYLDSDERIGRVHEGSVLANSRGFVAGRMQIFSVTATLYAAQLECGEFRSAALAKDALSASLDYSTSALAASEGFVTDEVEIDPLGDASAAVAGTLDAEGFGFDVAQVWYATDTVLCTVLGFADAGDPLLEVVVIAQAAE